MKKRIALVVLALIILALSGCHSGQILKIMGTSEENVKLMYAISFSNIEAVKEAVNDGASLKELPGQELTLMKAKDKNPLSIAMADDKEDIALYLLEHGADPNYSTDLSVLMFAVYNGQYDICELLLNKGADVNFSGKKDYHNITPLSMLFYSDYYSGPKENAQRYIDLFLKHGAKLPPEFLNHLLNMWADKQNTLDHTCNYQTMQLMIQSLKKNQMDTGLTAFMEHVILGESEKAEKLIDTRLDEKNKEAALLFASAFCNKALIEKLLVAGCSLETQDVKYYTLLQIAAMYNTKDVVQYLSERGMSDLLETEEYVSIENASAYNVKHDTFSYIASHRNKGEVKVDKDTLLIAAREGNLSLIKAAEKQIKAMNDEETYYFVTEMIGGNQMDSLSYMLDLGLDVNLEHEGTTFLKAAALHHNNTDVVRWLLDNGANAKKGNIITSAVMGGNIKTIELLLQKGANVNGEESIFRKGDTPLRQAVLYGRMDIIRLLLEYGADLEEVVEEDDNTVLLVAVENRSYNVVKLLKEAGADCTYKNAEGETALSCAKTLGETKMMEILSG